MSGCCGVATSRRLFGWRMVPTTAHLSRSARQQPPPAPLCLQTPLVRPPRLGRASERAAGGMLKVGVSQLSVFVENRPGHLADTLDVLARGAVNVLSFTIADTADYGILRIVVDDPPRAKQLLTESGYAVVEHCVVCAVLPDEPGGLAKVARVVADSGIDIEYVYLGADDSLLLRSEEISRLEKVLVAQGVQVVAPGAVTS